MLPKTSSNELQMVKEVLPCQHPSSCVCVAAHILRFFSCFGVLALAYVDLMKVAALYP